MVEDARTPRERRAPREVRDPARERERRSEDRAVYIISVAAELAGVHPQTLRTYERLGLLSPQRTSGNTRRYSERDIERLRLIQELTQDEGVNLAGVKLIMAMRAQLEEIRMRAEELEERLAGWRPSSAEIVLRRSLSRYPWEDA